MYCPYCRCEAPAIAKRIVDTEEIQVLPACCFQHVQIEERNPHCLTRFEMLDLIASKLTAATLHELSNEQLYLLCVGLSFVRYPEWVGRS